MDDNESESLFPTLNILKANKYEIQKRLNSLYQTKTDINFLNYKDDLKIDDNYRIKTKDFKKTLLPTLLNTASHSTASGQSSSACSALLMLQIILFNDWKLQKSKLSQSALKTSLIPQLISINKTTNERELKEMIYNLYLLLCFVIADDNKEVKKLLLFYDNLLINTTIRDMNETDDQNLIKYSLILLQFYIYYSKDYETISPVLSSLIKLLKNLNKSIVSQTCYTLVLFTHMFPFQSRKALIESNVCKKLLDLWSETEDEELIKPINGIIFAILPRLNEYKDHLLSADINILDVIPKLTKSGNELNRIYGCDIIKLIAMKPICAKKYLSTEQIQKVIDNKTIAFINDLLENDNSLKVKTSALEALFLLSYNALPMDQLTQLAEEGVLKAVCSQLNSDNEYLVELSVLTIAVFLMEEYKDYLKNKWYIWDPRIHGLSHFAAIIKECEGYGLLCQLNERREAKETFDKNSYKVSDLDKRIESILVWGFGIETRPKERQPSFGLLLTNKSTHNCIECKIALADVQLWDCQKEAIFIHVYLCRKDGSKALQKIYGLTDPNKCPIPDCKGEIPKSDAPWYMFKKPLFNTNLKLHNKVEALIRPEIYKPFNKY